ncbi:MAG: hypothetical protein K2L42_02560 [Clostridia bacterium]|nr:hypothetical protein [Clostridia bacterium]
MQEEANGISLRDILKTIFTQKWLALIIAIVITVGGVLAIQLGYNNGQKYYTSQFSLVLPEDDKDGTRYTYPDGTPFQYADMVAYKSLNAVKETDERFADIDIDKIVKKGAISVSRDVSEEKETIYTLTAKASYFPNGGVARDFLVALANVPVKYLSMMNVDYNVYLSLYADADDYESEISLLNSQLDYVVKEFETLIKNYGGNFVANGKTLSAHYNEAKAYADKNKLDVLFAQVREEGILKSEDSKEKYAAQKVEIDNRLEIAQATLDVLLKGTENGQGNIVYVDAEVLKNQSDLVQELTQQKKALEKYSTSANINPDFENAAIKPEYDKVKGYTDTLSNIVGVVYEKASSVAFTSVNAVTLSGGMGMLTSVLLCLIAGLVIACLVAYIVGAKKQKKEQSSADHALNSQNETVKAGGEENEEKN